MPGLGAAGPGAAGRRGWRPRKATSWSPGQAGPGSRTGPANSPGRVAGVMSSGAIGSKTAARPGGTGSGAAARDRDVPAVDGDLDGSGHRDHARGQLTVPDGDHAARPARQRRRRPAAWLPGRAAARPGQALARGVDGAARALAPAVVIASCSTPIESLTWSSNVSRSQPGARGGTRQELRGDHRGTGERVTDRRFEQLQSPAQRGHGGTAWPCAGTGSAAGYVRGRPNDPNRPGFWKADHPRDPGRGEGGHQHGVRVVRPAWFALVDRERRLPVRHDRNQPEPLRAR